MLKLVRNTLGDKTFLSSEKGQIFWNYIQSLVELQENEGLFKAICKKYLNVRNHFATKTIINNNDNIRNMYIKLILFERQLMTVISVHIFLFAKYRPMT